MRRVFAFAALLILTGCHGAAPRWRGLPDGSPEAEALAGAVAAPALEARYGGVTPCPEAQRRMERVGQQLSQASPALREACRHCCVLDSDAINAFSLPGGRIYVTRGLYVRLTADDLLAAVLAHEMAHIAQKDHFRPPCGTDDEALRRELVADSRAVSYLQDAGLPPDAMARVVRLIRDVQPPRWCRQRIESIDRVTGPPGSAALATP